jgi:phage shock protein PspC (stress-responsive transcriptional regulator)
MNSKYIGNPITKDRMNRKLSGVCAGIARHYRVPSCAVRLGVIVFGCLFPIFTIFGYLLAVLLMPDRHY